MHIEFEVSWWSTKMWLRRRWRRTLIRLHLAKPYTGPPVMQVFGPIKLSKERLHGKLYEVPEPFKVPKFYDLVDEQLDAQFRGDDL